MYCVTTIIWIPRQNGTEDTIIDLTTAKYKALDRGRKFLPLIKDLKIKLA